MWRKTKRAISQPVLRTLFLVYLCVMVWLLFVQRMNMGIAEKGNNINLVPFETLKLYWHLLFSDNKYYISQAIINLVGNVIMFVPFGIFIPVIWPSYRNFVLFLFLTVLTLVVIEILQYFTSLGSCDVDDFILNFPGVMIGYMFARFAPGFRR